MAKYLVMMIGGVGVHDTGKLDALGNLIMVKSGEKYPTDQPLHEIFPDKFKLISQGNESRPSSESNVPRPPAHGGEDVTSKFPSAESAGLTVLKIGDLFSIFKAGEELANGLQTEPLVVSEVEEIVGESK